eukprot:snap_masked-scaffold_18-processed-gene-2.39-mRNA-1 protein AED:0.36 eAED:0.36 QI:0/-1/0/1/-1/1/1/0/195
MTQDQSNRREEKNEDILTPSTEEIQNIEETAEPNASSPYLSILDDEDDPLMREHVDTAPSLSQELKSIGNDLFREKRYEEALDQYKSALAHIPHRSEFFEPRSIIYNNCAACLMHLGKTGDALEAASSAVSMNPKYTKAINRKKELEGKLKNEMFSQLKGLGNSFLSNFGMSLDNFKATQDPKTGGYNISYNPNK